MPQNSKMLNKTLIRVLLVLVKSNPGYAKVMFLQGKYEEFSTFAQVDIMLLV